MSRWSVALRNQWRQCVEAIRSQPRRMAMAAVPWLLSLLVGFPLLWVEVDNAVRRPSQQAGREAVDFAAQTTLRWLARLHDDARFLAYLTPRLAPEPGEGASVSGTYASFLRAGRHYHKVRWLDAAGREVLRLDHDGRQVSRVSDGQLQAKRHRPFVQAGLALEPGEVHLSALDLDMDHGRIVMPPRPTLRSVAAFQSEDGERGLVVINNRAQVLLDLLREQAAKAGFRFQLVHPQGYWLVGPEPDDAWGWQLDAPGRTLAQRDPELWRAMQRAPSGTWEEWTFATLQSAWAGAADDILEGADPALAELRVLVAPQTPAGARWKLLLALLTLVGIVVALLVIARLARSMAREAAYVQRLREVNRELSQTNERLETMQEGLARAERLASLGMLVAGVAHEMNTPLGSARLALSTLRESVQVLEEQARSGLRRSALEGFFERARETGALAEAELQRASGLVQRFKQVAVDGTSLDRSRFDLAEVVSDSDPRLRQSSGVDGVRVALDLTPGVEMDSYPGPLGQVVSNLLGNALAHGFRDGQGGEVRISAHVDGPGHARILVEDSGRGIPAADLPRIFEPFFTTGRHRGGTGLGLHIVHQIVTELLGGTIEVGPGGGPDAPVGTRFTVRIPRTAPERSATAG